MGKSASSIKFRFTDQTSEDSHSYQMEETDSVVRRPLVQTSNGEIDAQSGIFKLPVELFLLIFRHSCYSGITPRLVLTHVCRQWRLIAVSYPHLWTNIYIKTYPKLSSDAKYEYFEFFLSMQVDRCDELPLDVVWLARFEDDLIRYIHAIQNKAPFSRWRSLRILVAGRNSQVESVLASVIAFPNLESLVISGGTQNHIANIFCRAAMPKLQLLNLEIRDSWETMMSLSSNNSEIFIPDSIITFHAGTRDTHLFPNILNYKLDQCIFRSRSIDLRSMTSLIIEKGLCVYGGCDVLLPALRYLRFMWLRILPQGKIEAPVLQRLHISSTDNGHQLGYAPYTMSFDEPGYHLSPKKLVIREPSFSKELIIKVLKKSPELTQATLCFNDLAAAQGLVETLFESSAGNAPPDECLCPQLGELLLDCEWDGDMALSAEQWLSRVKRRKENPPGIRVSIKARRRERTGIGYWRKDDWEI